MKKIAFVWVLLSLVLVAATWADPVPKQIPYTKKTTLAFPATYHFKFSLWDVDSGGDPLVNKVWEEEKDIRLTSATIKTTLGGVDALDGVDFSQQLYVQVERWKSKDGTYVPVATRDSFGVVPYAMWGGLAVEDVYVNTAGDTMTGLLTIDQSDFAKGQSLIVINRSADASAADFQIDRSTNSGNVISATTSGTGSVAYLWSTNSGDVSPVLHVHSAGPGLAGNFEGKVNIINGTAQALDISGDVTMSGDLAVIGGGGAAIAGGLYAGGNTIIGGDLNVAGTKNFIQPHPSDPSKELVYVAMEGPESVVFLRGTAKLTNGCGTIETPEHFRTVAADDGMTVQFTPRYSDTYGLAAVKVSKKSISVAELKGGKNSYEFDYFITAKRAGFEKHEPVQPNMHFSADHLSREEFEQRYSRTDDMALLAIRNLLMSNGILTGEGKLNMEVAEKLGWRIKETDLALIKK